MKFLFAILFSLIGFTGISFAQHSGSDTINAITLSDTSEYNLGPGFYLVLPDVSKAAGFPLFDTDEYFYIGTDYQAVVKNVDTVYKEFDKYFNQYVLTFKFNASGTKELLDLTTKYKGRQIGLLIDNKLVSVALIPSPIGSGIMTLGGRFTEAVIDDLKIKIEAVIKNGPGAGKIKKNAAVPN